MSNSFNRFLDTSAGKRYIKKQQEFVAKEKGYESVGEMVEDENATENALAQWELDLASYNQDVREIFSSIKSQLDDFFESGYYAFAHSGADMMILTFGNSEKKLARFAKNLMSTTKLLEFDDCGFTIKSESPIRKTFNFVTKQGEDQHLVRRQ